MTRTLALIATLAAQAPTLTLVEHTYDGPVMRTGTLLAWHYTSGRMSVDWVDTSADGIYRGGFEVAR